MRLVYDLVMGVKRLLRYFSISVGVVTVGFGAFFYSTGGFGAVSYAALQWATESKRNYLARALLVLGAPPSPKDSMIEWHYFASLTDTPLHVATKNGDIELVDYLLEHGAVVDWCCCSCVTPLHNAILSGNATIVERLLRAGANTEIQYDLGPTSLELAKSTGKSEIVQLVAAQNRS